MTVAKTIITAASAVGLVSTPATLAASAGPTSPPQHKLGDSFVRSFVIPAAFADGYFVGWTVKSQIRSVGQLVDDVVTSWLDPATTRHMLLTVTDTTSWKPGLAEIDVQFKRTSDGFVMSTTTAQFVIISDVTAP